MAITKRIGFDRLLGVACAAGDGLRTVGQSYAYLVARKTPIVGHDARRRRRAIVLAPYARTTSLRKSLLKITIFPLLMIACLVYGWFFGLVAPYIMVPFAVPIVLVTGLIIWALPEQRSPPTLPIEILFPASLVFLILWPDYLAISLPGLPWITMLRLITMPMAALLLISLSVSQGFRRRVAESATAIPLAFYFFCGFLLLQIFATLISPSPLASAQIVFNFQVICTTAIIISCALFRDIKYVERYWALLCVLAIPIIVITFYESTRQHIVWASHIPSFLRVPDSSVQLILKPIFRPGTNFYRAKATFATPLALAEYLALLTPFLLHFAFSRISFLLRLGAIALIPIIFLTIRLTDSRLGLVGMLVSILLYGMLWSIVRWRRNPHDLFSTAIVYAYPAIFLGGIGLVFASHRLKLMLLGDGAQAGSTAARENQLDMALHKLWQVPWGHGIGQSGLALGYSADDFITVDNYFITVAMDYGVLGVVFWYGIWIVAILTGLRYCLSPKHGAREESRLLIPLIVTFCAFLVIKWVHGQDDNHLILYMLLGMTSALVFRLRQADAVGRPHMARAESEFSISSEISGQDTPARKPRSRSRAARQKT